MATINWSLRDQPCDGTARTTGKFREKVTERRQFAHIVIFPACHGEAYNGGIFTPTESEQSGFWRDYLGFALEGSMDNIKAPDGNCQYTA
jgi:hypothetical protein